MALVDPGLPVEPLVFGVEALYTAFLTLQFFGLPPPFEGLSPSCRIIPSGLIDTVKDWCRTAPFAHLLFLLWGEACANCGSPALNYTMTDKNGVLVRVTYGRSLSFFPAPFQKNEKERPPPVLPPFVLKAP